VRCPINYQSPCGRLSPKPEGRGVFTVKPAMDTVQAATLLINYEEIQTSSKHVGNHLPTKSKG
jgi:hypothetical protein